MQLPAVLREAFLLQSLSSHHHVVGLYGVVSEQVLDGVFMTVMEQAPHGTLKTYIQQERGGWTSDMTLTALYQVGHGTVISRVRDSESNTVA
jgi:serine/threonine protein kinase